MGKSADRSQGNETAPKGLFQKEGQAGDGQGQTERDESGPAHRQAGRNVPRERN